ncbi:MAG: MBL fold metallo-hydrolase [Candidatus Omnitrophota bacterium]
MQLTIHRGTKEIGGSCIELQAENARILVDFGIPLSEENYSKDVKKKSREDFLKDGLLPAVDGLYDRAGFDAVLLSHAHQDHYGLLSFVHQDIPIFMSRGTKELIELSFLFGQTNCVLKNVRIVEAWKPFLVKDVKVTPYLVDHSGFDAMAFFIEADGKRIFYSGDFRGHGRKDVLFNSMIKKPLQDIDYLIMEGTMLSRENAEYRTEKDIEKELVSLLKSQGNLTFLSCSSQNIDRLVSAYRACMKTDTLFVVDPYTAYILHALKDISKGVPQYDWGKNMRIFFIPNRYTDKVLNEKKMYKFGKAKITKEEVFSLKQKMLVKDSYTMRNIFRNKRLLKDTSVIYSQWEGYLDGVKGFWDKNGVKINQVHVSGHAYVEDLVKFTKAIKSKNIIPIHTEKAEDYQKLFGSNILLLDDGNRTQL